ncbi:MAG: hypothetical protein MUO26_08930 [Methanotrichaceae archaeon]|nr:hypothetical protein [Methanotrichaceae archaeon]
MNIFRKVLRIHWALWSIIVAAAINFAIALDTGSMLNLLACLVSLIGLAGVIEKID